MQQPVSVQDYEERARELLPRSALDYYRSGALEQLSLHMNRLAFQRFRICPKVMKDVSRRDHSVTVLGTRISLPVGISPTAMQRMAHPDGECGNAKGAGKAGAVFILSTISTSSIEEVAEASPNTVKWFQLYIYKDRELTKSLVQRAERAGYKALVLTVDAPYFGIRYADVRNNFQLPSHLSLANFTGIEATDVSKDTRGSGINQYVAKMFDPSLTWADVKWLKSITKLPLVLKGILRSDDASFAADLGVSAVFVSNHGGRQVDGSPSPIEVLQSCVKAVDGRCEVYLDGGIRTGTDVFKALALGARMVFVGRPALWGLTVEGALGVSKVINILRQELDSTMALAGCRSTEEITSDLICHESKL